MNEEIVNRLFNIQGFPKFTSQICQIWQICWIHYKKLNQYNKTNYFLQYIRNWLFIPIFILPSYTEIWMDWQIYLNHIC